MASKRHSVIALLQSHRHYTFFNDLFSFLLFRELYHKLTQKIHTRINTTAATLEKLE